MRKVILFSPDGYVGGFIWEKLNVENGIELLKITRESRIDFIEGDYDILIYSASVTSARKAAAGQYIRDNALCAVTITEFCRKHSVKRIIYLSSDEIYGQLCVEQVTEDVVMCSPNIYATTKYLAEKVIMESGIGYYILRLPGIVGKRWGCSFLYRLIDAIRKGKSISVYYADKEFNNVVDIDDLIDFIITLMYRDDYSDSEVFLLGNTYKTSLRELVDYIKGIYASDSEIVSVKEDGERYFTLDVAKAVKYGYQSKDIRKIIDGLCQYRQGMEV